MLYSQELKKKILGSNKGISWTDVPIPSGCHFFSGLGETGLILLLFHFDCYLSKSNLGHGFPGINFKVYPETEQLEGRKKLVFD